MMKKMLCILAALAVCTAGLTEALDFSRYRARHNDAVRNGITLTLVSRGDERMACITLPARERTVTNVYDFALVPDGETRGLDLTTLEQGTYRTHERLGAPGELAGEADDRFVFSFILTDRSCLDSTVIRGTDTRALEALVNRVFLEAGHMITGEDGVVPLAGPVTIYNDIDRDQTVDPEDRIIGNGTGIPLGPGEEISLLVTAVLPRVEWNYTHSTISLTCRTRQLSRSGEALTRKYSSVITIGTGRMLQASVVPQKW